MNSSGMAVSFRVVTTPVGLILGSELEFIGIQINFT
jgi:hypothetical protein